MAHLEVRENNEVRVVPLSQSKITVGRRGDNDIVLKDDRASRYHCTIEPMGESFMLNDLGSRNGTKVNGDNVQTQLLHPGDKIMIGRAVIRIVSENESRPVVVEELAETDISEVEDVPMAILDDEPEAAPVAPAAPIAKEATPGATYGADLRRLIAAGREIGFAVEDIAMLDRHGTAIHAAGKDSSDRTAVRVLRMLLLGAFRLRATDLHFEPKGQIYHIRFRVDGTMLSAVELPDALGNTVLSVVKILSEIDIAKRLGVQEGSFSVKVPGRSIDFRVSFTPTTHGQKLVLRVLDKTVIPETLNDLGMPPNMLRSMRNVLQMDSGMVIVSGPTGSGKTTTLYTAIRSLDYRTRNIVTIEDPVEYQLDGITQVPVDIKQNLTFANLLTSMLRQDPDVILVGEIRDPETARVAMQAAITGHLVFTTLHARDTIGSIFRLIDLGVEPYMVANAVTLCIAQRLVRTLCESCKKPYRPGPSQLVRMKMENRGIDKLYTHVGCAKCMGVGFLGRKAIFETLSFNDALRDAILTQPTIHTIRKAAGEYTFQTLVESGYTRVAEGMTSIEEVDRVAMQE